MDLRRFLDLYTAEAQEHVQLLQRSLLALEQEGAEPALDAAFRAAHTLKGISAAMGYDTVASLAHSLEDRLADGLLEGTLADGDRVVFGYDGTAVSMEKQQAPSLVPAAEE